MLLYFTSRKLHPKHYYWGNHPAYDGLNLLENEGVDYSSDLKVLYLGVGDFRNVPLTCASLPDTYERVDTFALNDTEICILQSRLVLFVSLFTCLLRVSLVIRFLCTKIIEK